MEFPVRGGRGGGRGLMRGGRGRLQQASGHTAGAVNARKTSPVPAFPVVRRASNPGQSQEPAQHITSSHRVVAFDDDDAPPAPKSARQADNAAQYNNEPMPAPSARFGSSAKKLPRRNTLDRSDAQRREPFHAPNPSAHSSKPAPRPSSGPQLTLSSEVPSAAHMITTITDNGTELPQKLNNKIFIDGLPYQHTAGPGTPALEDELFQFLTAWKVGKPLRLIKKPGQGFGFVVFKSPNSVPTAVKVLNGRKFLGRPLRVEVPKPRDLEKLNSGGGATADEKENFRRQVLLTDLAKMAQPEVIREVLRDIAPQLEHHLQSIKMTSRNRKAFLTFESEEDVGAAITFLDRFYLLGRRISAIRAAPPGTLPYSRSGTKVMMATGADGMHKIKQGDPDNGDEDVIIPLGADISALPEVKNPKDPSKSGYKTSLPAINEINDDSRRNRTETTSKYDLLVKGSPEVYVGNLGEHITTQQLREHFEGCGKILSCEILVHPETHLSTGIAKIVFALPAYAARAREKLHGSRLRNCVLRVDHGDDQSAPLASELPPVETAEYDEDAYLAARFGIKDKKSYFKGTSFAEKEKPPYGGKSAKPKRAKRALDKEAEDVEQPPQRKKAERGKKGSLHEDADLVVGGNLFANEKESFGQAGSGDDEEEYFFDVDDDEEAQQHTTAVKGNKGKPNKRSAVAARKAEPAKHSADEKADRIHGATKAKGMGKTKTSRK